MEPINESNKIHKVIECLETSKAIDIVVFDGRTHSILADYFIFCSGNSESHLRAISNELQMEMKRLYGLYPRAIDGSSSTRWIVADYYDFLIHIFYPEVRTRYAIEALFEDYPLIYHPKNWKIPSLEENNDLPMLDEYGHKIPSFLRPQSRLRN